MKKEGSCIPTNGKGYSYHKEIEINQVSSPLQKENYFTEILGFENPYLTTTYTLNSTQNLPLQTKTLPYFQASTKQISVMPYYESSKITLKYMKRSIFNTMI